jgi:membrane protease YdiL (CAAX protease family)
LAGWLGPWAALALVSVLFGLVHPITPAYAVLATLAGAYLGWAYLASGNLLVPVLAHALYDFTALVYLLRGPRQAPPSESEVPATPR